MNHLLEQFIFSLTNPEIKMESLQEKKIECKSCKGSDHKLPTSKLCPNSRWGKMRAEERIENTNFLIEGLKIFEDFIMEKKHNDR